MSGEARSLIITALALDGHDHPGLVHILHKDGKAAARFHKCAAPRCNGLQHLHVDDLVSGHDLPLVVSSS